jgi:hypothetical protein
VLMFGCWGWRRLYTLSNDHREYQGRLRDRRTRGQRKGKHNKMEQSVSRSTSED